MPGAQSQDVGKGREERTPFEIREVQDVLDNGSQLALNKIIFIICCPISEVVLFKLLGRKSCFQHKVLHRILNI